MAVARSASPPMKFSFDPTVPVWVFWNRQFYREPLPRERHLEYEVHFIKRGEGVYEIEDREWRFAANSLISIRPNQPHRLVPNPRVLIEKAQFHLRTDWLGARLETAAILDALAPHIAVSDTMAWHLEMLANRIREENTRREPGWADMVRELLHELLLWMRRANALAAGIGNSNALVAEVREYVDRHYADSDCTVTKIANVFGYSLGYLSAAFKAATGDGLKHYLLRNRVEAALRWIEQEPGLKLEAVARQSGFVQYRSFARSFQRLTGFSPNAFLKKCLADRA